MLRHQLTPAHLNMLMKLKFSRDMWGLHTVVDILNKRPDIDNEILESDSDNDSDY
jgi:hypothetical protein